MTKMETNGRHFQHYNTILNCTKGKQMQISKFSFENKRMFLQVQHKPHDFI